MYLSRSSGRERRPREERPATWLGGGVLGRSSCADHCWDAVDPCWRRWQSIVLYYYAHVVGEGSAAAQVNPGWGHAGIGIAGLLVLAGATLTVAGVRARRAVFVAAGRALVQLLLIGALVRAVFNDPLLVVVLFALMLVSAALVSIGRIKGVERARIAVVAASFTSSTIVVGICFAVPVVPRDARDLVAIGGIVIGGSMTACTLSGRAFLAGARARREEIEAWLSIGATMRHACIDVARTALSDSLVPALDQTRTVGLVTLPGTFVGALLGGATPADAARVQLVILVAVLTAQAVAGALLLYFIGSPRQLPEPLGIVAEYRAPFRFVRAR